MRLPIALALLSFVPSATLRAQILDVRSTAQLPDLRPGDQARNGEVVLGQTSVTAALRMFAVELRSEMVSLPLAHSANPDTIPSGTVWLIGPHELRPYRRLELGADRYVLNFDRNDRLISASPARVPNGITQPMLAEHYPGIHKGRLWRSGDVPLQEWIAPVDRCVVLSALVRGTTGFVEQMSYAYTCETKMAAN
ncbi:MAG: hypothetical protein ACJ8A6_13235 [Gemmatimonadales bacterium]